jgi:hypothetical protein
MPQRLVLGLGLPTIGSTPINIAGTLPYAAIPHPSTVRKLGIILCN